MSPGMVRIKDKLTRHSVFSRTMTMSTFRASIPGTLFTGRTLAYRSRCFRSATMGDE